MTIRSLPGKDPEERVPLTFDFESETTDTDVIIVAGVALEAVVEGADPAPNVLDGAAQIGGRQVVQWVKLGVNLATYRLKCSVTTQEGRTLVLRALLPVFQEIA